MHAFFWGLYNKPEVLAAECEGEGIDNARIPFTLHWGKFNSYLTASRVRQMYGDAVPQWISSRETLLDSPDVRDVFTNQFVQKIGLSS